jgi:hypothetical protein
MSFTRNVLVGSLILGTLPPLEAQTAPQRHSAPLALTHVSVVSVKTGQIALDQTLLTDGKHITAVGSYSTVIVPPGIRQVDGRGAFLIPGLWDMHVHLAGNQETRTIDFPLFIANGVTGVRDMWGDCTTPCASGDLRDTSGYAPPASVVRKWKQDVANGLLLGPRVVAASNVFDGVSYWPGSRVIRDTAEAREAVQDAADKGVDFIKPYSSLDAQSYFMVLRTARRLGLPVAGHLPSQVSLATASDSGQRSIEHLGGVFVPCSRDTTGLGVARKRVAEDTVPSTKWAAYRAATELMSGRFHAAKCADLFAYLGRNGTWMTPTLTVLRSFAMEADSGFRADSRVRYTPSRLRSTWNPGKDFRMRGVTRDFYSARRTSFKSAKKAVKALSVAGVPILAGSDVRNAFVFPGFGLHDELLLLVEAGLSPREALEAATLSPARFLNATDSMGTIEAGKLADLVLLKGNPLKDIQNTQRILGVVAGGRYFDRGSLDSLLTSAAAAAQQH